MSNYTSRRNYIIDQFGKELDESKFNELALDIFRFQFDFNPVYRQYCKLMHIDIDSIVRYEQIPFLPIEFFKTKTIKTGDWEAEVVFRSSGTTGQVRSQHFIRDLNFYLKNCVRGFSEFFGTPSNYCFLAVLPGYMDRPDSSLIYMVNDFICKSRYRDSGFYLGKEDALFKVIERNRNDRIPTVVFGVSFGLLDLSKYNIDNEEVIIIETGGMKNSKIEMTKAEMLAKLRSAWKIKGVFSEYGMTELLSQSYALDGVWYRCASTKKVVIGNLQDPFGIENDYKTGIIKVIDLANFDTCSFIETQDLGIKNEKGHFQVLGRMDNAELRGCNLLLEETLKNPVG